MARNALSEPTPFHGKHKSNENETTDRFTGGSSGSYSTGIVIQLARRGYIWTRDPTFRRNAGGTGCGQCGCNE